MLKRALKQDSAPALVLADDGLEAANAQTGIETAAKFMDAFYDLMR